MEITILALTCWRITNLICNEGGPFNMFGHFRAACKRLHCKYKICTLFNLEEWSTCEWCMSIWVGGGLTLGYLLIPNFMYFCIPFALSTITIALKFIIQGMEKRNA